MPRFDGARLRARRTELKLSRQDVAELSKQTYSAITRMERGEMRASVTALEAVCRALSCTPDTFFDSEPDDDADLRPTELGAAADRWIAETLATAPPLTERQAARISALLFKRAS